MLTARVCRCGKDVTSSGLPTPLWGIMACPVCGKGVLDQDDRNRIAWRRARKVDASLTRFVLQLHAFPMAFLALDDAGLWLERAARKSDASFLVLPIIWTIPHSDSQVMSGLGMDRVHGTTQILVFCLRNCSIFPTG